MKQYEEINTPEELLQFMDNIKYGFTDEEGKNYGSWNEEEFEDNVFTKWHVSSPERLIKVGYGHCFDQVELERDWFTKHGYKVHTYYMMFVLPYENPFSTHTFLIYEKENKYYYFEHSDYSNRGIHAFDSLEEALAFEKKHQIEHNQKRNPMTQEEIASLKLYEYQKPKENSTMREFIDTILDTGKETIVDIENICIRKMIKRKLASKEYSLVSEKLAIGEVYKIHKFGSLEEDGFEIGYLYLPAGTGIKEHEHTEDIERYRLVSGVLRVFGFPSTSNICLLNHVHCIDQVPVDTIIETCKISKEYLQQMEQPIESATFDNILKKQF